MKPTVGRKVWYDPTDTQASGYGRLFPDQPFDATIIAVHSDDKVNLHVVSQMGMSFYVPDVKLREDDKPEPGTCRWMPYQKQVAQDQVKK